MNCPKRIFQIGGKLEKSLPDTDCLDGLYEGLRSPLFRELKKTLRGIGAKYVGQGSSRVVYSIGTRYVVKIANGAAGVAQNRTEAKLFNGTNPMCNVNVLVSPTCRWIIARRASKPTDQAMREIYGVGLATFNDMIRHSMRRSGCSAANRRLYREKFAGTEFFVGLAKIKKYLCMGDLDSIKGRYGIVDKKLVLIDGGLTPYVYGRYYNP